MHRIVLSLCLSVAIGRCDALGCCWGRSDSCRPPGRARGRGQCSGAWPRCALPICACVTWGWSHDAGSQWGVVLLRGAQGRKEGRAPLPARPLARRPVSAAAPAPRLAPPLRHALSACTAPSAARPAPAGTARRRRPSQVSRGCCCCGPVPLAGPGRSSRLPGTLWCEGLGKGGRGSCSCSAWRRLW